MLFLRRLSPSSSLRFRGIEIEMEDSDERIANAVGSLASLALLVLGSFRCKHQLLLASSSFKKEGVGRGTRE